MQRSAHCPSAAAAGEGRAEQDPEALHQGGAVPEPAHLVRRPAPATAAPPPARASWLWACPTQCATQCPPTCSVRLWTTDGFRLYDPHDIWPLVDQDTCIVASDKNSFPGDITQLKRAMDGGAASDGGGAEPRKKVKREPTDYHRCE